mgnify:CR=1 FL=1
MVDGPVDAAATRGQRFVALRRRLDRAIAKAWQQEIKMEELNG